VILGGARPTSEHDTATFFELSFEVVHVFAATHATGYKPHVHDALGVPFYRGCLQRRLLDLRWGQRV
jgi:hypothetical protein